MNSKAIIMESSFKVNECIFQCVNWEVVIGSLIVVIGWFSSHHFSLKRDAKNKRKDLVLNFLINSYRTLTNDISDRDLNHYERQYKFESLISDLQLFGSKKQVELARTIAVEKRTQSNSNLDLLINDLKDSLRKELNLENTDGNVENIRFRNQ
jgi:hypothetical protein